MSVNYNGPKWLKPNYPVVSETKTLLFSKTDPYHYIVIYDMNMYSRK